ncbi:hypothetical protein SCLCIDRAFT_1219410 [Scleroderma citrinum Foug A]|uniref:Uncharacterized protein n=1 Tax=Scleroderma citrinum Foug A TaxID=1036808 RepID=A0A0C3DNA2_9AGAM|nr:hypothetical protein SCLCIDRAFT_1219410 [Scleroderma citrinum Foug A]
MYFWILLYILALTGIRVIFAQILDVECSGSYSWIGPNATQANPCKCNTVMYSLISACGACQGEIFIMWNAWSAECGNYTSNNLSQIPAPTDIIVPPWAFLAIGRQRSLLATPTQSSTTTSATSTPLASSSSHLNTGVIIGVAMASAVGFAILGFLIVFCMQCRTWRNSEERVDRYSLTSMVQSPSPSPFQRVYDTPATSVLYNPDDPNTFPKLGVPQDFSPQYPIHK